MSPKKHKKSQHFVGELKLRRIAIDTYHENVAYLHRNCEIYRAEGFQALTKIEIHANGRHIIAVLNVVDDDSIVSTDELGLAEQAFQQLDLNESDLVSIAHASPPASMDAVRKKVAGNRLTLEDFRHITQDITENRYSKLEMSAFLVASAQGGLDREEVLHLTQAMIESGERLDWGEDMVVDKHCIGGIPGNRTTMIIVPIVTAHGLLMPKTSSRAITSPAGTADTMSVLANVNLSPQNMRKIVQQNCGCLAWGGKAHLAPADDILISVERPLGIDSEGQMVASILSKKVAAGATHLLIDIPVGPTAKVRHMRQALSLRKLFEYTGDRLGIHLETIITDGSQPIGRGIGPALEARDVMQVLENHPDAPADLRHKALHLAGRILEFDPAVRGGQGYPLACELLESGKALDKMLSIIESQGTAAPTPDATLVKPVTTQQNGIVTQIDNYQLAKIARLAGAPMDKQSGVALTRKLGDQVREGDTLYNIHAAFSSDFEFACQMAMENNGYRIGRADEITKTYLEV
ncbi:MAG: thymidine phosphorylase family protein [Gammaproteobacteria bacterium]